MNEYINYSDNDYLAHHGVKGMKWGVRRDKADRYFDKANKLIGKAEKKSDLYGKKAHKAISKQQKLQSKRFATINKLQKQGRNDEIDKYQNMSNKEKKLFEKYKDNVNKYLSLREFSYNYDIDITGKMSYITDNDVKRGRNAINSIIRQ